MAPEIVDRVEFSGIRSIALKLLRERGVSVFFDPVKADLQSDRAWRAIGKDGELGRIDVRPNQWKGEIFRVITGSGPVRFEQSLNMTPLVGCSAVIVDGAQDRSCVMMRMLRNITGDRPDALTLIGDGQQTIYPGGYTLSETNITIAGDEFLDIEGAPSKADVTSEVTRHGIKPKVTRFTFRAGHDLSLIEHVRTLLATGVHLGDIGISTPTNDVAGRVSKGLATTGLKCIELLPYDGKPVDAIKVGTIKRAEGLEFTHVLVMCAPPRLLEPAAISEDTAEAENRELVRRELYVAMTLARYGLRVGVACVGHRKLPGMCTP